MVRLGGESGKWFWLPCSTVGKNVVVPFVFLQTGSDMLILLLLYLNDYIYVGCNAFANSELKYFPIHW
jgi:hypothetical protein